MTLFLLKIKIPELNKNNKRVVTRYKWPTQMQEAVHSSTITIPL